ncbi:shTK domain protein, partial [Necator americanus]
KKFSLVTRTISSKFLACKDRTNRKTGISECPFRAGLCDIPIYSRIMTVQCPRTCGKCPGQQPLTKTACVDLVNPATNSSECSSRIDLCMDPVYQDVMMKQCRKTCGFCSSTTNKTAVINPAMRGNLKKVFPRRHQKNVQNDNKTYFLKITLQDFIGNGMR